ncbi:hypothetical protein BDR07DRAFT_1378422 [Suillus spraguei]|nr:hypothetical protein BDR07DRAFT_1378422 [Suillus spraguei]
MNTQTQDRLHPQPKACPLPRSKCSDPMTSSAEEDIFFSNFSRHSSLGRKKHSDVNEAGLKEDGTSNDANEESATNHREQTAFLSDGECGGATVTNEGERSDSECSGAAATDEGERSDSECSGVAATNEGERDAGLSDGKCGGTTMTNEMERDAVPSDGECDGTAATNKQEKTAVAPTTVRPCRSGAHKLYAPGHESKPAESSDSDSDWAELEEKQKKAEHANDPVRPFRLSANDKQKGPAVADDHGDNANPDPEGCNKDQTSEDGDGATHKAGRLSKEGILKRKNLARGLWLKQLQLEKSLGNTRGTSDEGNLQRVCLEPPSSLVPDSNLASWKVKQNAHYHAHWYKDFNHASLWKKIQHHWNSVVASPEDLSSRESSSLMTAVREVFAKLEMRNLVGRPLAFCGV